MTLLELAVKRGTAPASETEALLRDLDKPSLHVLSYALRHPDTWPKGFVWDFSDCNRCAMGLAHKLWASSIPQAGVGDGASIMASSFAMPFHEARKIFFGDAYKILGIVPRAHIKITPDMVADAIDAYLARAE